MLGGASDMFCTLIYSHPGADAPGRLQSHYVRMIIGPQEVRKTLKPAGNPKPLIAVCGGRFGSLCGARNAHQFDVAVAHLCKWSP